MRSSSAVIVLMLCACNRAFGVVATREADARLYDGLSDASFACPPTGTPPTFVHDYRQAFIQPCTNYSESLTAGRAIAECSDASGAPVIQEGAIDSPLSPAVGLQPDPGIVYDRVELGADGDLALVRKDDTAENSYSVELAHRDDSGWTVTDTPFSPGVLLSTGPTRGPNPHVLVELGSDGLDELVQDDSGTWNDIATYSATQLGAQYFSRITLSPDGLRLLASVDFSSFTVYYGDRASIGDPFENMQPLANVQLINDVFMSEDCGRLYFPALGEVLFADQAPSH